MNRKTIVSLLLFIFVLLCLSGGCILYQNIVSRHARSLITAIRDDDMEELSRLLDKSISPNGKWHVFEWPDVSNNPPISEAVRNGSLEAVELLLEAGADINLKGANGMTPLHYAVVGIGQYDIAYYLVEHGADVNATNDAGETPLEYMVQAGPAYRDGVYREDRYALALFLIEAGTELFHLQSHGNLMYQAATGDDDKLLAYLWEHYAMDVDQRARTRMGQTALMFSVMRDAKRACRFLLAQGADKTLTDKNGKPAYDYAVEYGHTEIAELVKP